MMRRNGMYKVKKKKKRDSMINPKAAQSFSTTGV